MLYHAIATLPGGRRKSIINKTEEQMLTEVVIPYVSGGVISARWGEKNQSYQVIDLRVYKTEQAWDKREGNTLEQFIGNGRNVYSRFEKRAKKVLGKSAHRVFIIMPIQGEKFGSQNDQRIYQEFDQRFEALVKALADYACVAIRIDKEHPLDDLVLRIKDEIQKSKFVIADLTDERPSCYFEAGYAEALKRPVIYIASKESVINPKAATKIHFDVHMSVNYFTNHAELISKVRTAIEKNKEKLFPQVPDESKVILTSA